jgi:hypothetical protein
METDNFEVELEKLPTNKLKEFRDCADYIIYRRKTKGDIEYPSILYQYIADELFLITRKKYPDYFIYVSRNKTIDAKLKLVAMNLIEYLHTLCKGEPDKTTIVKFLKLFADLVISNINENLELPLNFTTVLSMADDFPSILDRAFPGYIRAGIILKVVLGNRV